MVNVAQVEQSLKHILEERVVNSLNVEQVSTPMGSFCPEEWIWHNFGER